MKRVLRAILGRIRLALAAVRRVLMKCASRSGIGSSLYYAFLSWSFRKEQQALLQGLVMHADRAGPAGDEYALRRNIHRLEKGMCMRPRRDVFAVGYITKTVSAYQKAVRQYAQDAERREEITWAYEVLKLYFGLVGGHPSIEEARKKFESLPIPTSGSADEYVPRVRGTSDGPCVRYDDLLALAEGRKSVRWFIPKKVPREVVDRAITVALCSPSACNRQPFVFRIVDDPDLVSEVASVPMGTKGYHENIPAIVAVVGHQRAFAEERDKHLIYIDGSLAAMSFIYGLESQGVSSCSINWPDIDEKQAALGVLLGLEPDERVIMLIAIGYADPEGMVCRSQRKSLGRLRRYNLE